jgi:ribosomal protein S13
MTLPPHRIASIEAEMDAEGIRDIYDHLIKEGESPNMAAMLASMKAPGSWNTGKDFSKRENERMKSLDDQQREDITELAKKSGISTHGKTYNGQLGGYTDPMAWVSDTTDVKNAAVAKEMEIDGMVKVNAYRGPRKKVRLAKDIVDRIEMQNRMKDPKLDEKCRKSDNARTELRNKIVDKHGAKKKD